MSSSEGSNIPIESDLEAEKVRQWRWKLQRALLPRDFQLQSEDMPEADRVFTQLENYNQMTAQSLTYSKFIKVMRYITRTPPTQIPREEEFHFRGRAQKLIDIWTKILEEPEARK